MLLGIFVAKPMSRPMQLPWELAPSSRPARFCYLVGASPKRPFSVLQSKDLRPMRYRPVSCSAIPIAAVILIKPPRVNYRVSELLGKLVRLSGIETSPERLSVGLLASAKNLSSGSGTKIIPRTPLLPFWWRPAQPPFKRVLVFSPEPLDAEIGMAGTLHRLVNQRHEVTLAYLTSGNLSVPDGEARMAFSLLHELGVSQPDSLARLGALAEETEKKAPFDEDSPELRRFKGLIRKAEARASCQILGLNLERVRFLDLAFYEQGRYRQFRWGPDDVKSIAALICLVQPHQIYLTGAGADPSSIAGIAFQLGSAALRTCTSEPWFPNCQIWFYASNERPWPPHEIDMAVPLSPA